jgi:hypothetical protein
MNKLLYLSLFVVFVSYLFIKEIEIYDIVKLDSNTTGAKCLDGSDYQFYIQKGYDDGQDKLIFFFDGGGWCSSKYYNSTLESCFQRSFTYLGSSEYGISQLIRNFFGKSFLLRRLIPFLSSDSIVNPSFYNWNKVFLSYCDGRGFVGYNKEPLLHKNKKLYFRGYNNTIGALNYVKEKFPNLENLIISGTSAGGVASLYYTNFISDYFSLNDSKVDVQTITDSGFFLDLPNEKNPNYNFGIVWKDLLEYTKPIFPPVLQCDYLEKWKCFLPEYFYQKIKIPVFILHSQYDTYAICHLLGSCEMSFPQYTFKNLDPKTQIGVDRNRAKILDIYKNIIATKPGWGIYSPACFVHDFLIYSLHFDKTVAVKDTTIKDALQFWYDKKQNKSKSENEDNSIFIDDDGWPSNPSCNNYRDFLFYLHYFNFLVDIF